MKKMEVLLLLLEGVSQCSLGCSGLLKASVSTIYSSVLQERAMRKVSLKLSIHARAASFSPKEEGEEFLQYTENVCPVSSSLKASYLMEVVLV